MTIKRLLPLTLLALPFLAAARPAYPGITKVKNADGTMVELRGYGDENFNYYTNVDGSLIYEINKSGNWAPAMRFNRTLTPSASNIEMLKAERVPMRKSADNAIHKMAELSKVDGRTTYPTVSDEPVRALVVLLEFAGTPFSIPNIQQSIDDMVNKEGYSEYGAHGSARDYFLACSNNKFNVHFDVSEVVPLKHNSSYYMGSDLPPVEGAGLIRHRRWGEAIQEAIAYLDERGYDFSQYDYDNNKDIDNIFFFYSGYGQADSGDPETIWPHQGSYQNYVLWSQQWPEAYPGDYPEIWVDGVRMRTYACSNELNYPLSLGEGRPMLDGIGAFCHEYGHVLGLPDLYDIQYNGTKTPGDYSIMASGSYNDNSTCPPLYSAYEQWLCRWVETEDLYEAADLELASKSMSDDNKIYRIMIRRPGPLKKYYNEWFFIEARHKEGWDEFFPEEGVFIWRVDYTDPSMWPGNIVNSMGTPRVELMTSYSKNGKTTEAWPGEMNVTYSMPTASNAIKFASAAGDFQIFLSGIEYDKDTKVAKLGYNTVTSEPDDVTVMHSTPELANPVGEDGTVIREFLLSWDPVPGATGYMLTVKRTDSRGITNVVGNYDDFFVGNVNWVKIDGITSTAWKQDFTASVRVVKGLPSSRESNTISFKPTELEYTAVDGIGEEENEIFGGIGCVIAPEGAEVFNLNGVRTGADNLPAGMYIVRSGKNVKKVIVK
ncbi:MAG: M6 family metalloprotease domain-containing protein [Muribaculaceae bacterium]|nr:M6 family metalloprotease domain-containing protein [Muribaculaceae bacterium]